MVNVINNNLVSGQRELSPSPRHYETFAVQPHELVLAVLNHVLWDWLPPGSRKGFTSLQALVAYGLYPISVSNGPEEGQELIVDRGLWQESSSLLVLLRVGYVLDYVKDVI